MAAVAYNPDDPLQTAFLTALAQGETGGSSYAATEGVGGSNLAGDATDQYGFPQWTGLGNSHAAGIFQFQPGTWDSIASEYDLNFQNPSDQSEGAWYEAEQADPNLESQLQSGDYSAIQSALQSIWPSVTGNQAAPQGLAASLSQAISAEASGTAGTTTGGTTATSGTTGGTTVTPSPAAAASSGGLFSWIGDQFARGGLIIVGTVVILVALWMLLSNQGVVPGPKKVAASLL